MPHVHHPTGDENNGHQDEEKPLAEISPIVLGRPGRPSFSLEALRERVERQFRDETSHRDDILLELDTEDKRREMLADILDYVLAVEAISLNPRDKRTVLDRAYRYLFSLTPLDDYLRDETITEIVINGPHTIHIRQGMGNLVPADAAFDDHVHLENVLERVLAAGGITLSGPFLETGIMLEGRLARISLVAPPVSPEVSLEIRLHPRSALTLDELDSRLGAVPPQAAALLRAILAAGCGLLIVGDVGLGKTTLAGALVHVLPAGTQVRAVERAAEMLLPDEAIRHTPARSAPDSSFADEILHALGARPDWLLVDEIRGDESAAVHAALTRNEVPHYLWVFRGDTQPDRLRNALSMVIRKHAPSIDQTTMQRAIVHHLPFVAALKRIDGVPRLELIAEWTAQDDTLALRPLLRWQDGVWQPTGITPAHPVDWSASD